jgi:hypothetical protein
LAKFLQLIGTIKRTIFFFFGNLERKLFWKYTTH